MKKYKITITLENGDKVDCRVEAESQSEAINRLFEVAEFHAFVNESGSEVKSMKIDPIEESAAKESKGADRFLLQTSKYEANKWICTDTKNNIVVSFQQGDFNGTREITFLEDFVFEDQNDIARYLREVADYLFENYKEIL